MQKHKRITPMTIVCDLWQECLRFLSLLSLQKVRLSVFLVLLVLTLPLFSFTRVLTRVSIAGTNLGAGRASALAADKLNFQARLQQSNGSIVPDGFYHIEFKLYSVDTGGTALWTETRTTGNLVRVANGYVSVYLGDVTPLPTTIPWDQQLYLTMNIGGTAGAPTWDGEMNPRLRLTAVPYAMQALRASEIATSSGANLATLSIEAPTSGNQTFVLQDQGAAGTYNVLTDGNAATILGDDFIQNQNATDQTANFRITGIAQANTSLLTPLIDTATATALNIGTTNATQININQNTVIAAGKTITITGGNTASRPASPTEGMVYFDTDTKQLLTYANGKWQTDRSTATKIIAASNSSQATKDSADFVADDEAVVGVGTIDGDQVQINAAIAALPAAGGSIYLAEGTYRLDGSIVLPSNVKLSGAGDATIISVNNNFGSYFTFVTNSDTVNGNSNITIRDLRFHGNSDNNAGAVLMKAIEFNRIGVGNGATAIQGLRLSGVSFEDIYGNNVTLENVYNSQITDSSFINSNRTGVSLMTGVNNILSGNTFNYVGNAVELENIDFSKITNNIIDGSIDANGAMDINSGSSSNTITGNTFRNNTNTSLRIATSSNNFVSNNLFSDNGGSGGVNIIDILGNSDDNVISSNTFRDTVGTGYVLNMSLSADRTVISGNSLSGAGADTINDTGTNTIYENQLDVSGRLINRTTIGMSVRSMTNNTTAFQVQNATGGNILTVDTTNSEVELGNSTTAGKLVLSDGSSNTVTISVGALAGDYTLGIPTMTSNDTLCLVTAANCANGTMFIQNQNASDQTANFRITGTAQANTSLLTPLVDTATATALNIGTTNATTINLNQNTVLAAGKSITITGGNTASRPASQTEGMVYFDTTTKQLLTYSNGKWQADKSDAILVAASNSSQADKDAAQYIADGNTAAAADGDQVQINAALTAAAGKKVILLAGTYTVDASISVPNNTTLAGVGNGSVVTIPNSFDAGITVITNTDQTTGTGVKVRDVKLDGNKANQTTGSMYGIKLYGMGAGVGASARQGAEITSVTVINFLSEGLYLIESNNNILTNNISQGNYYGIDIDWSSNNTLRGNIVQGNLVGISLLGGSNNNLLNDNLIAENSDYGISSNSSDGNTISDNKIADNGGSTSNQGIWLNWSDFNTITNNTITDTSATTTNYAIINNVGSTQNYLADNRFSSTPGTSTINDAGTGTVYANQARAENGAKLTTRTANDTEAYTIQNATGGNILTVDTTNSEVELGNSTTAGKLVLSDGSSNTVTISVGALAGDYTLGIPTMTSNDTLCLVTAANCANGTMFIQNQNASDQTANFRITGTAQANTSLLTPLVDTATAVALNIGTTNATSINIGSATAVKTIQGTAQTAANTSGTQLTIKGSAGLGSGNGGALLLSGGDAGATGVMGLVNLNPTAFTSSGSTQTFAANGSVTGVDTNSSIAATASVTGVTVTVPMPAAANRVVGRILYVTAVNGTNDFNLALANTSGVPSSYTSISMKQNSTATLIWNGYAWTAAGASSSTDLQSAYNNTLTSAGGAELVLNASGGAADGLTIRNNSTIPISGGILEIQSSIGTNLFSVNNYGTELAANGGAETATSFVGDWTGAPAGGTVTRNETIGQYVTGQAGAQVVTTVTANTGIRNNLSGNPVNTIGAQYQVSFTAKSSLDGTPIDVVYSRNGGTNLTYCTNYGDAGAQNLSNTVWKKITCTITIDSATAATNPDLIIRKTNATTPTIYIDNLSFMRNDSTTQPSNVQIGGGINGGQVTLFTLDRSSAPPVANGDSTYYGSMYYDTTTGRIQCYESDGWGACGSAPDNIVVLTPEYSNAVLGGPGILNGVATATGVGTMTADFCSNQSGVLQVNTGFCASGISRNYYRWTSPQATSQTYSIYVSYKLPSTFKQFYANDTVKLTALKDHVTNSGANLSVFKSTGGAVTQCGTTTTITTSTNSWVTTALTGDEMTCSFVGGDIILFKIDVSANSNASVYIENLEFRYTNV